MTFVRVITPNLTFYPPNSQQQDDQTVSGIINFINSNMKCSLQYFKTNSQTIVFSKWNCILFIVSGAENESISYLRFRLQMIKEIAVFLFGPNFDQIMRSSKININHINLYAKYVDNFIEMTKNDIKSQLSIISHDPFFYEYSNYLSENVPITQFPQDMHFIDCFIFRNQTIASRFNISNQNQIDYIEIFLLALFEKIEYSYNEKDENSDKTIKNTDKNDQKPSNYSQEENDLCKNKSVDDNNDKNADSINAQTENIHIKDQGENSNNNNDNQDNEKSSANQKDSGNKNDNGIDDNVSNIANNESSHIAITHNESSHLSLVSIDSSSQSYQNESSGGLDSSDQSYIIRGATYQSSFFDPNYVNLTDPYSVQVRTCYLTINGVCCPCSISSTRLASDSPYVALFVTQETNANQKRFIIMGIISLLSGTMREATRLPQISLSFNEPGFVFLMAANRSNGDVFEAESGNDQKSRQITDLLVRTMKNRTLDALLNGQTTLIWKDTHFLFVYLASFVQSDGKAVSYNEKVKFQIFKNDFNLTYQNIACALFPKDNNIRIYEVYSIFLSVIPPHIAYSKTIEMFVEVLRNKKISFTGSIDLLQASLSPSNKKKIDHVH